MTRASDLERYTLYGCTDLLALSAKRAHLISVSRYLPQEKCLVRSEQSGLISALVYQYWQGQTLREFFLKLQLKNLESTSEIKSCSIEFLYQEFDFLVFIKLLLLVILLRL